MAITDGLWRDANDHLDSAKRIVGRDKSKVDLQALRTAASQAQQAANTLHQLIGHYDALCEIRNQDASQK